MEITFDTIISLLGLFIGGGGGAFFTWRYMRRKAKAEAQTEEVNMAKAVQDTYQEMLEDKQKEVADNQRLIAELREDRDHYKQGYIEMRNRQDKTEEIVRDLQMQVARNGRMVEVLRPFICTNLDCQLRQHGVISADGEVRITKTKTKTKTDKSDEILNT
jgi:hypothetical protein